MDWRGLMSLGVRRLGLKPAEFWQLTPAELLLMLGFDPGQPLLTRARLADLARRYPDLTKGHYDDD
ncbi:phage tail assembly chaperone [Tropicimonas sp.]|uniref:phage tail assembly chaperone n=1 Tax=Tropicimonas sp. TaxID=2067044 RepID=UPI003A85BF39